MPLISTLGICILPLHSLVVGSALLTDGRQQRMILWRITHDYPNAT